jgi:uncharacterized membrane protein YbhN (UPF0104 family)
LRSNSWVAAGLAWLIATVLVCGIFQIYLSTRGESMRWVEVRNVSLITLLLALLRGFRDRGRNQ